ncbi:hypothetical protein C1H46_024691 [Malus baccata]|uniref:C-JID domain-containing protein n=1 Tax=Malus baccata TaxID=106549 RepID=A0A540LTA3_MALBA|nr:hypothetical protein C1H46_024691 [Malus baccata]
MGQAVVGQQSKEPGGRSRLWFSKDIFHVLKEKTGVPYAGDGYEIVMPGKEIPGWFTHQRMGPEVSVDLTPQWRYNKMMGCALCAVFEVYGSGWELSGVLEVNGKEVYPAPLLSSDVQLVSDHIWLLCVSRNVSFGYSCNQLNFHFKSSGPCLVKNCGSLLV